QARQGETRRSQGEAELSCRFPTSPARQQGPYLAGAPGSWAGSLIRIGFLPEVLARPVEVRPRLDGHVAPDAHLAGEAHLVLVADAAEHVAQREALEQPLAAGLVQLLGDVLAVQLRVGLAHALGGEVLHALFDEHLAAAAGAVAQAVEVAAQDAGADL